jgi:hypothetical protein
MERKFHALRMEAIVFYMVCSEQRGAMKKVMMMMQGDDWASLSSSTSDRVKHGEWIKTASPVMVIIQEHGHINPHVVHDHREMLKHGIYGLTGEMSEVLVLSPVGRKEPSLNLSIPAMSILQLLPNPAR